MKKIIFAAIAAFIITNATNAEDNISGTITCGGIGVENVVVSDGYVCTLTDANGQYSFESNKKNGYVFYVIPSGYMPYENYKTTSMEKIFIPFYKTLSFPNTITKKETADFKLKAVKNDKHIMVFGADPQMAKKENDVEQYQNLLLPRIKKEVAEAGTTPIYSTMLGDLAWDAYWANGFTLGSYRSTLDSGKYPLIHFSVTGNHDHDPQTPTSDNTDFMAAGAFRQIMGPNYYSYNIGKIHYVVLDDINYINENLSRNYTCFVVDEQLEWLKKDLQYVDKKTPVIVSLHCPLWKLNDSYTPVQNVINNSAIKVCDLLKDFKEVHILSGHRHTIHNMILPAYPNIMEHSVGAIGGNLWFAGNLTGSPICQDGTPGGYEVFYMDNDTITWKFHDLEYNDSQFRVIDLNTVKAYYKNSKSIPDLINKYNFTDFRTYNDNIVLVNVFNYDPKWKVQVYEDGKQVICTRILVNDPTSILAYDIPFHEKGNTLWDQSANSTHIFRVQAKSATSTLTVKVTDRFGNIYQKNVIRPIPYTLESLKPSHETISAIRNVQVKNNSNNTVDAIYDLQGKKQNGKQKGINIIKYNNGTSKKVIY